MHSDWDHFFGHKFVHVLKMWVCLARILVLFCCVASCKGKFDENAELEWNNLSKLTRGVSSGPLPKAFRSGMPPISEFRILPDFIVASSATDQKHLFRPEMGVRPVPNSVMPVLFPSTTIPPPGPIQPKVVEMLCHLDRIYVRVARAIFKTLDSYKYLKLGTCPVNQGTPKHYYFLYMLTSDCGFQKESKVDHLTIKNVVHYQPTTPVLRDLPFDVPVQCNYHRLLHSYKVGIRPKLQGGTLFKSLRRKRPILLVAQDALGNEITRPYVMEEPMFFEAKLPPGSTMIEGDRMYINKCFITPSIVPSTSFAYTVIDNYGCMVDSKMFAESKFLTALSKTQKFTINALILTVLASSSSNIKQLYMHCDIAMGKQPASEGLKACNYDKVTKTWKELYGNDLVCACCDSTCSPPPQFRANRNIVTSQPWKVDLEDESTKFDADLGFEENATD